MSCWSRAGCCWGWKSASKFQKELSTKLSVGISVKLRGRWGHTHGCLRCVPTPPNPSHLSQELPPSSPHLQEDLAQLRAHLEQRVQVPAGRGQPQRGEVVGFEGQAAPGAPEGGAGGHPGGPGGVPGGPGGSQGVTYVAIISAVSSVSGRSKAVLKALPLRIQ